MSAGPIGEIIDALETKNSATLATVAGVSISANALEIAASSSIAAFTQFVAAIKAKNYVVGAEITIDEALTIAKDFGVGGIPVAVLAMFLPTIFEQINKGTFDFGDLQHNAGETQAQDVQSSIGIGRR